MNQPVRKILLTAIAASGMAISPAVAQNPNYAPGDLVLAFQNPGGATGSDQTVYINLGNTALIFRDATADLLNIININVVLEQAFGSDWENSTTLYAGLAGVWGNGGSLSNTLQNGDPNRTLYVSKQRTDFTGNASAVGSSGWTLLNDASMTAGANGIINQNNVLETQYGTAVAQSGIGISRIDDENPFIQPGVPGAAFGGSFPGGVQDQGEVGSTTFGGQSNEFTLDLFRILAKTTVPNQVGGPLREGTYEGTVVVDSDGDVSFLSVPEPSSAVLFALAAGTLTCIRRRKALA